LFSLHFTLRENMRIYYNLKPNNVPQPPAYTTGSEPKKHPSQTNFVLKTKQSYKPPKDTSSSSNEEKKTGEKKRG